MAFQSHFASQRAQQFHGLRPFWLFLFTLHCREIKATGKWKKEPIAFCRHQRGVLIFCAH